MADIELSKPIDDMTKDELREAALLHGVDLDMTKKRADLIVEVKKLHEKEGDQNDAHDPVKAEAPKKAKKRITHLKHPANGRVYVATEHLLKRGDMLPCDADGKLV